MLNDSVRRFNANCRELNVNYHKFSSTQIPHQFTKNLRDICDNLRAASACVCLNANCRELDVNGHELFILSITTRTSIYVTFAIIYV